MKKFITIVSGITLLAMGFSARAQIVIPSTTVTFYGNVSSSDELSITYEVTESGGLYTYSYDLSTSPAVDMTSFTIGNSLDPVNTVFAAILSSGGAFSSGFTSDSVVYEWSVPSDTTNADVSYTSPFAPTFATFTLTGGDAWSSPPLIPAPVPEAPTLLAGALMVLPFGVGIFRALRKERRP